jgi:Flp pilus assembly protein TadB
MMADTYLRVIALCSFLLTTFFVIFLLVWNVRAERQKKMLQTQIDLLAQLAAKAGVSIDKLSNMVARERVETGV